MAPQGYWLTPMCGLTASTQQALGTAGLLNSFNCAARGLLSISIWLSTRNYLCQAQTSQRLMNCSTSTTSSAAISLGRARRLRQGHSTFTGAEEAQDFSLPSTRLLHRRTRSGGKSQRSHARYVGVFHILSSPFAPRAMSLPCTAAVPLTNKVRSCEATI